MNNNDDKYDDPSKIYDNPYTKEQEHKLTNDCYMELLDAVSDIVTKHFEGKIVTPRMYMNIFLPILTTVLRTQFDPVPKEIRDQIFEEFFVNYTYKFRLMINGMKGEEI